MPNVQGSKHRIKRAIFYLLKISHAMGNSIRRHSQAKVQFRNGKFVTTDKNLTCCLCEKWLVKPVQSTNGCRFCEACFWQLSTLSMNGKRCKGCKREGIPPQKDCYKLEQSKFFGDWAVMFDRNKEKATCVDCGMVGSCRTIRESHADGPCSTKPKQQLMTATF